MHFRSRGAALVAALLSLALLAAALPTLASAAGTRTTFLLSRGADGGFPNGPSSHPAVSHDNRIARLMAYQSDASNIVGGDSNGASDVFVVSRAEPWGVNGTPWSMGPTQLASVGLGGAPANGPSTAPSLDGDSNHAPHCVAFISAASNLVEGDTNGQPDAFVRNLSTGVTTRVSVGSDGSQASGATTEVSIDGACERVAFTSTASNLALKKTARRAWKSARTAQATPGTRQVYVHVLSGVGADASFTGLTFLASASASGAPGNGDSTEPSFGRAGKAVAFTSTASNLVSGDGNGATDVYLRTFTRKFAGGAQTFRFGTALASSTPSGRAGNGSSAHPSASDTGQFVAFQTSASDVLPGDSNGASDIAERDFSGRATARYPWCSPSDGGRICWVSKSKATSIANGASANPSITGAGEFVLFDSDASNLRESSSVREDGNGVRDLFLWNRPTGNVSLESRAAPPAEGQKGAYLSVASGAPATSSRGNYVGFVSKGVDIDLPLIAQLGGGRSPDVDLVYVRYLGTQ